MTIEDRLYQSFVNPETKKTKRKDWVASYLRKDFTIDRKIHSAELFATACGIYRLYINGTEIEPQRRFAPGFTNYKYRLQFIKYDVSQLLCEGENVLGAVLGNGWYRGWSGCTGGMGENFPVFGKKIMFSAVLHLQYEDGTEQYLDTSAGTLATQNGSIQKNDMRGGEVYDATKEMENWAMPQFHPGDDWHAVRSGNYDGKLIPQEGLPVICHEERKGKLIKTPAGERVIDFGQNMAGIVRFKIKGVEGKTFSIIHGETLDENGNFTLKNISTDKKPFGQVVTYTMKDGWQEYEPHFCYMGFRYIKLVDFPMEVYADDFTAVALYSDLKMTGDFWCSDERINQLFENARWSLKSNFIDIPTDCPTREHSGWSGDAMVFCEAANWICDNRIFWKKWLRDLALQQQKDGKISCIAPDANPFYGSFINGSAGWGDAIEIIPMKAYEFYGDKSYIEEFYPYVCKWIAQNEKRARKNNIKNIGKKGEYRSYILDTGYHWGEWKEPDVAYGSGFNIHINCSYFPDAEVATGCFAHAADLAAQMAEILGRREECERYRTLFLHIKNAYNREFLPDGLPLEKDRQCRYVRPLAYHLVDGEKRTRLAEELKNNIQRNNYHIGTGFLTTGLILAALSENGQTETAYRLLQNEECPGWLYCVKKGATTTWEDWDGVDGNGVPKNSLNHYSAGSVIAWFFREMCGIHLMPENKISITPNPGGTLTFARAEYRYDRGKIVSSWKKENDKVLFHIEIPAGMQADFIWRQEKRKFEAGIQEFAVDL